jgi:putative two-component system response regulator
LDVRLPNMDGHQVCNRLKRNQQTQHIPVIMFTVSSDITDRDAGYEAGADAYIQKDREAIPQILAKLAEYGFIAAH